MSKAKPTREVDEPSVSELEAHLGYWLRFVSNHVSHAFQSKVEAQGVTVSEWVVLRELYRGEGASPGAVAAAIGMTRGAISKLLARLQAKGLVGAPVIQTDRRQQLVALTAAGRALVPQLARLADENDEEFFGHLAPSQRAEIMAAMESIVRQRHLKTRPID